MCFSLHTMPVNTNRNIALQDNPLGTSIVGSFRQLNMQLVLNIINKFCLRRFSNPFRIWNQPRLILLIPDLKRLGI